ncbi:MAG: FeoA family protein [Sphingobium sp.]|nr:ferrous iron transport protein A [Sphingobium sp.]MCP5397916.1 ferrous iron transport protein A [Sphingomonas sp.]
MQLDNLPLGRPAFIDRIQWDILSPGEAQRLREFGVEEGASVEALHRGGLMGGGALACRIGRMTIAMRRNHAHAIHVRLGAQATEIHGIAAE